MNGKGSRPRPKAITDKEWGIRHALTFNDWVPVSFEDDVTPDGKCRICDKPYLNGCACADPDDHKTYEYKDFDGQPYARRRVQ